MTTARALHTPLTQHALSLVLAVMVTAGLLAGVLVLASDDAAALIAREAAGTGSASVVALPAQRS